MKNLQYFKQLLENEDSEPIDKTSTQEDIVDKGVDKEDKKQIEEDAAEAKRIADEKKKLKEESED